MIRLLGDNILVTEEVKDSNAGVLKVSQDESSAYMFVKIEEISDEAACNLFNCEVVPPKKFMDDHRLVIRRTAKDPFIQNKFFISYKDVRAVISKDYMEEL